MAGTGAARAALRRICGRIAISRDGAGVDRDRNAVDHEIDFA